MGWAPFGVSIGPACGWAPFGVSIGMLYGVWVECLISPNLFT